MTKVMAHPLLISSSSHSSLELHVDSVQDTVYTHMIALKAALAHGRLTAYDCFLTLSKVIERNSLWKAEWYKRCREKFLSFDLGQVKQVVGQEMQPVIGNIITGMTTKRHGVPIRILWMAL